MPGFSWPAVVISGGRDLITPPAVAERIASLIPHAVLLRLPTMAHSALDSRENVVLEITASVGRGELAGLAGRAATLDALPGRRAVRLLATLIALAAALESGLPSARHRNLNAR